ncbi:MAG: hypothetical protein ABSG83_11825, partial [Roseiarcus sp.]
SLGYSGTNSGGALTITDGAHFADIALLGQYAAASFVTASDGHGGTLISAPSAVAQTELSVPHA